MKRIILFVEGEGEAIAGPNLVSRIVTDKQGHDAVFVDPDTFRVKNLGKLVKNDFDDWGKKLRAAAKRRNLGGVLLLLDGDSKSFENEAFCPASAAKRLAEKAKDVGGGSVFSVACVFACQEFESWFIAAIKGFRELPDGRRIDLPETLPDDPESSPRDAKSWLRSVVNTGYKPTQDQAVFANAMDFELLRVARNRSFLRLENAVSQLIEAARSENHAVSPE